MYVCVKRMRGGWKVKSNGKRCAGALAEKREWALFYGRLAGFALFRFSVSVRGTRS